MNDDKTVPESTVEASDPAASPPKTVVMDSLAGVPRSVISEALRKARFASEIGKRQLARKREKAKAARKARKAQKVGR